MKEWLESSHLAGANAGYIEDLYEAFLEDATLVSDEWRAVFTQLPTSETDGVEEVNHTQIRDYFRRAAKENRGGSASEIDPQTASKQVKVLQMINAYRFRGHQHANLDPLGLWQRDKVAELNPAFHTLDKDDMDTEFNVGSFAVSKDTMKLKDLHKALEQTYCGSVGAEYMHITDTEEKRWIQQQLESVQSSPDFSRT